MGDPFKVFCPVCKEVMHRKPLPFQGRSGRVQDNILLWCSQHPPTGQCAGCGILSGPSYITRKLAGGRCDTCATGKPPKIINYAVSPHIVQLGDKYPPCFDSEGDYLAWVAAARDTTLVQCDNIGTKYCYDCTPEFRREMQIEGRCTQDCVKFIKVNGAIEGRTRDWKARGK